MRRRIYRIIEHQVASVPPSRTYTIQRAEYFARVEELTDFQVASSPPSCTYTTARAGCFANIYIYIYIYIYIALNTWLVVHRHQEPTHPYVQDALRA